MRKLILALAGIAIATPAVAQQHQHPTADPDKVVQGAPLPAGWHSRLDRADASPAAVRFVAMEGGYHATMGPAAIFWNPQYMVDGDYSAQATFTQTKAPQHPEGYGLIIGGEKLDAADQSYVYFLVRQDGKFLVNHRAGVEVHKIVPWTENAAINKADAQGKATNALRIDVVGDSVRFLVNGTEVQALPRPGTLAGIAGLRVNHNLDVHIADFAVRSTAPRGK